MTQFMGESPAEILVMSLEGTGFQSPANFVRQVSRLFGQAALAMYAAILRTIRDPSWIAEAGAGVAHYSARTGGLGESEVGRLDTYEERSVLLHDHRNQDDFSEEDAH